MIGFPEIILIGLILVIAAVPIVLLVLFLGRRRNRGRDAGVPGGSAFDPEARLALLDELKASGRISEEEYREKRRQVVGEI